VYQAAGSTIRALSLRRLDNLNWTHTLLGFTGPHLRDALVLLDQVEEQLVHEVLPAFAPDETMPLADDDAIGDWVVPVEVRAGEMVRLEYATAGSFDSTFAGAVGAYLARRRALFRTWNRALARDGVRVHAPQTLHIPPELDYVRSLANDVPSEELDELARIEQALTDKRVATLFIDVRNVLVASIERHEVQHRIDSALATPMPMPAALEELVGPIEAVRGRENRTAALARDELAAYLCELARDTRTTRVNLSLVSRFLFDQQRWGTVECYAAIVMFDGLAGALGLDGPSVLRGGGIDRERAAAIYLAMTERPPAELRRAAAVLWSELFGRPLPAIEPRPLSPPPAPR
jgi:hypothetical protein